MTGKIEKTGLELFIVTDELLQGMENCAAIAKKQGDRHNALLFTNAKIGLSKVPSITPKIHKLTMELRERAKELNNTADHLELLFPQVKSQEKMENLH